MLWIICVPLAGASLVRIEDDAGSEASAGPAVQITWIRHGLSCANMNGLAKSTYRWAKNKACNFRLRDPPLANHAVHASAELSSILRSREQYDFYGASHLLRAQQTAALMFAEAGADATAARPVYVLPYIAEDLPGADNVADLSDVRNATNPTRTFGFENAKAFVEFRKPVYQIPIVDFKFFSGSAAPVAPPRKFAQTEAEIESAVEVSDDSPADIPESQGTRQRVDAKLAALGFKKTDYETPHMGNALDFIAQNVVPFVKASFPGRNFDNAPMKLAIVTHSNFMKKNLKFCFRDETAKEGSRKPCNNEAATVTYRRHVEDGKWRLTPDVDKGCSFPLGDCGKPENRDNGDLPKVLYSAKDYSFCEGAYANCPAEYADSVCPFADAARDLGLAANEACPALGEKGVPKVYLNVWG